MTERTLKQWSELLKLHEMTLRRWRRQGRLIKTGELKTKYGKKMIYTFPEFESEYERY